MSSLTTFFYPLPALRRDVWSIWHWWETRRFAFNLLVGATGCLTVVAVSLLTTLAGNSPPSGAVVLGALVYGFFANLCYTAGPVLEIALDRFLGERAPHAGPVLFRQGLLFSIGLTLFPIALAGLLTAGRFVALLLFQNS